MKSSARRILTLLMAVVLTVTTLGTIAVSAAQEVTTTDSYVLKYEGAGAKPYLYGSRYEYKHSYNDPLAGESSVWTYWNCPEIFNLVNSETGASIAAYCTDADTSTTGNTSYRRINLEDSTYHASGAAGKLRTIILNSFPQKSVADVAAAANAAGYAVTSLSQGELISATQQAIWETTHGDKYTVNIHSTGLRSMDSYNAAEFVYPESLEAELTDHTASNMENLYNYFLSLPTTEPASDAVSEHTFENVAYKAEEAEDGTYTVTVAFTVNTAIDTGDQLTLSATCGGQVYSESLQAGEQTVSFTGLAEPKDVKLEINGYEQGGDVYLFDAAGDRTASQSMIGYDDSLLPVHAEVTANADRILNLYKTTGDDSRTPLANIQFSIYKVGSLSDYLNGKIAIGTIPTEADLTTYATDGNLVATVTTDDQGLATWNFGTEDGVYLVVELENDVIEDPADPFFVCVSTVDEESGELQHIVNVYPKNVVIPQSVDIEKDVTEIGNDHDTFDIGKVHTWIIRSSIPSGMATGLRYDISDTLDPRLTYQENLLVTVARETDLAKQETLILTQDTDYYFDDDTSEDGIYSFVISLTPSGMQKAAAAATDTENTYEVRVYFDAIINTSADLGQIIPNDAHIDYTNNVGIDYEADSDVPEVHTGGLNILKLDAQTGETLPGATFRIARAAAKGEAADLTIEIGGQQVELVYVSFYATAGLSGVPVSEVTTGHDGTAFLYGLAYGDYYLIETAAPEGYNQLPDPVAVQVTATSHVLSDEESSYVTVTNSAKFTLPNTGGVGTTVFTVTGLGIICAAGVLFLLYSRKKKSA